MNKSILAKKWYKDLGDRYHSYFFIIMIALATADGQTILPHM